MPVFTPEYLHKVAYHIYVAKGTPDHEAEFAKFVKSSPPAAGFSEVLYPGEIEYLNEQRRRKEGILVEDQTWQEITDLMR